MSDEPKPRDVTVTLEITGHYRGRPDRPLIRHAIPVSPALLDEMDRRLAETARDIRIAAGPAAR